MGRYGKTLLACLPVLALLGCAGTETGNPGGQIKLAISAHSSDEARVSSSDAGSELYVDSALISFVDISLMSCSGDLTAHLPGMVVDLLQVDPTEFTLDAPSSEACGLVFEVGPPDVDADSIGDNALVLTGTRVDGTPFEIYSGLHSTVTLGPDASFDATKLILAFDLASWLDPDEVHGAVLHGDVAQIDDQANPDILAAIEGRLGLGAQLFIDANGDGHLNQNEMTPVAQAH